EDVAKQDAAALGGAFRLHLHDHQPGLLAKLLLDATGQAHDLAADAEVAMPYPPMLAERLDDGADGRQGHGQRPTTAQTRRVQPDQTPIGGDERPAGKTGVHDEVGADDRLYAPGERPAARLATAKHGAQHAK